MRAYEILYVIRPDIEEDAKKALVERFDNLLTSNGAEIVESKECSKRRLELEIEEYKQYYYQIIKLKCKDEATNKCDRMAKISNNIISHIVVRDEQAENK